MNKPKPIVKKDKEGEQLWFAGGGIHTWKVSTNETNGAFLLVEDFLSRNKATPLHIHPKADEMYYVLEGEILVHIDGTEHLVGPRGLAVAPRGVPHAFMVVSERARVLFFETPGNAEAFYRGASEPIISENDVTKQPDIARVVESAKRNGGIEILGPAPFKELKSA